MLILAMDANFWLKSKLRGLISDPILGPGWAYFVDHLPYSKFVAEAADDEDVSSPQPHSIHLLTMVSDRELRRISGTAQYANKVVKRIASYWHGWSQLCAPSVVPASGNG